MTRNDIVPPESSTPWERISETTRKRIVWGFWFVTWLGLLAGYFYRDFYEYVVYFSAFHVLVFFYLFQYQLNQFPLQLRVAYLVWVMLGTYIPHMVILMYIATIGLASNLFLNYCPLARMMYLLPWNREERFSFDLLKRVILTPPVPGRFKPVS